MAVKSVIDIEVNDADFQRYAESFKKYQSDLKGQPEMWSKVSETAGSAAGAAAEMGAAIGAAFFALHKISGENDALTQHSKSQAKSWQDMAKSSGEFAAKVVKITRSLLRWGELTGLIGGILGGGGLYGIDRLAINAGNQRRNALGLGVTPGEAKAFEVDYGRVVDPQAMLSGVNQALHDVTKRVGLYGAGMTENELKGKDTAQVSSELLMHLKKIADQTPETMMQNVLTARHLDQFINLQDFERLKNTPAKELEGYGKSFQADRQSLELTKQQQKVWQDLQVQFHRASEQINHDFIVRLTELAPALEHLSKSFVHLAEVVLNNPHMQKWIDDIAHAIDRFANYLDSPKAAEDIDWLMGKMDSLYDGIKHVVTAIPEIVDEFSSAVDKIKNFFKDPLGNTEKAIKEGGVNGPLIDTNPDAPGSPAFYAKRHPEKYNADGTPKTTAAPPEEHKSWDWSGWKKWFEPSEGEKKYWLDNGAKKSTYNQIEGSAGLPQGLLGSVEKQESGSKDLTSPAGAQGYFQFMPATAMRYDVNPHNEGSSAVGAARYFSDLMTEFKGDLAKSLAAYNWGETNVEKDVAKYGDQWREHLPDETKKYVSNILGDLQRQNTQGAQPKFQQNRAPAQVAINVHNQTGGNSYISASQLAVG